MYLTIKIRYLDIESKIFNPGFFSNANSFPPNIYILLPRVSNSPMMLKFN